MEIRKTSRNVCKGTNVNVICFILFCLVCCASTAYADKVTLYNSDQITSSLPYCMEQDAYGYIWIGTMHGLNRYDGYNFIHYFYDGKDSTSISNNEIVTIFCDSEKRLWIGTNKGLCRYDYATNAFVRYRIPEYVPRISCMSQRKNGDLLIGTSGYGMYILQKGSDKVIRIKGQKKTSYDIFHERIFEDDKGNVWWATHLGTMTKAKITGDEIKKTTDYALPFGMCVQIIKTDNTGFHAFCEHGVARYEYATDKFADANYDTSALPFGTKIMSVCINEKGNIGIGTSNRGFFCIPAGTNKLINASENLGQDASSLEINDLLIDKDGNNWISCFHKGVFKTAKSNDAFQLVSKSQVAQMPIAKSSVVTGDRLLQLQRQFTNINVELAVADGKGGNYISDYGKGLVSFDSSTGKTERFSMYQKDRKSGYLTNDWILSLYIDNRNMLWIGTTSGVSCMDIADKSFRKYGWNELLPEIKCSAIGEDISGNILLGTNQGLYIYNRKENKVSMFPHSEDLQKLIIYGIQTDADGDIWLGTSMGIWHWSKAQEVFIAHINGNGLVSKEYIANRSFLFEDGRIGFGVGEGVTVFNPSEVKHNIADLGRVYLSNVILGNKTIGCTTDLYELNYDYGNFALQYSMFNFNGDEDITFQYRINDADEWISIPEGTNSITLNRMEPGTYDIEVRAFYNGIYSSENCITTVKVSPPWFLSVWAIILYLVIVAGIIAFIVYYLERKRKADLDEQKMQFLINATHDIRSPLTLILSPLKKLKARISDPESQNDIETIDHNAKRLLQLVNQILDERKIDKNQMHLHCQETDMVEFVKKICHLYEYNANERNINFTFSSSEKQINAWIDHINFDKVMNNIISNAFKYTFDGGEINVNLHVEKQKKQHRSFPPSGDKRVAASHLLVIDVIDNGLGLKEEQPERLFERFYQGTNTSEYKIEGTGIGLNLSQSLVRMHGGNITASNRTDGVRGSVFSIVIPLGNAHLKAEERETHSQLTQGGENSPLQLTQKGENSGGLRGQTQSTANRNFRILIADDDPEIADYISTELATWYRFTSVKNGREAINQLLSEEYDLLISDIMMPLMDGIELLKGVKSNVNISHIPVVLLTSKSEISYRLEGLKKGADAYLSKPFDMEELHILIDNLVDNRRRLRGKFSGAQKAEGRVEQVSVKGNDDALMDQIMECINKNLTDPDFNVEQLSRELSISRAQLFRRMKEITGIPTSEFIRNLRLQQAARLLKESKINVSQVAYSVGFNSQTHFSTLFKKHFGKTPSEYAEQE